MCLLNVAGAAQWTAGGVRVCDAASTQDAARVIADGLGGAAVVWRDYRAGATCDLYGQHVDAGGMVTDQCLSTTNLVVETPLTTASSAVLRTMSARLPLVTRNGSVESHQNRFFDT